MTPLPGQIIICPGDSNLIVEKDENTEKVHVGFSEKVYREYNEPSINAVMESVAAAYGSRSMGVILTGMGKDGARGLKAIKDAGGYTVAQDKDSCVIYGMPKVAIENNAVDKVLDIREIGGFLFKRL